MGKFTSKLMERNFRKIAKWFLLVSLLIVIGGGSLVGFTYRTQLGEALSGYQSVQSNENNGQAEFRGMGENAHSNEIYWHSEFMDGEDSHGLRESEDFAFFDSLQVTEPTKQAEIVLDVFLALCSLLFLAYWILIAFWLYQAAEKASMHGPIWFVLGLFFNVGTVLVFVLSRSFQKVCLNCGLRQHPSNYCRNCGFPMHVKCPVCDSVIEADDLYCPSCGAKVKGPSEETEQ
ncbi:MAG TPA: hypothetical protein DCG32_07575 [Sphaerochaeta sp.]|jgi:hypothetical protein|nr:hypothetical protein [Sphaerochaeta sp.]